MIDITGMGSNSGFRIKSGHYDSDSEKARKNRKCKTENKRMSLWSTEETFQIHRVRRRLPKLSERTLKEPRIPAAERAELEKCHLILC